jgi:hypothetical protein
MQLNAFGSSLHLLAVLVLLVGGAVHFALLRRLKRKHPETWKRLGEPTLFLSASAQNQIRVGRYLWMSEYMSAHDRALHRLAFTVKALTLLTIALLVVGAILHVTGS